MSVVGVIPAAGFATRLQPLDGPKELLEVGGRPVMDYLVERMRSAPADSLRVVTRADKRDVVEHARRLGAEVIEARPRSLVESLLTGMSGLADGDVALIGFPDSIWEPVDGYARLLERVESGFDVALGLFRFAEPERSDAVTFDAGVVTSIVSRPRERVSDWIWGCAAGRVGTLAGMEGVDEPGVYFSSLVGRVPIAAVPLSETYVDIGTAKALNEARKRV